MSFCSQQCFSAFVWGGYRFIPHWIFFVLIHPHSENNEPDILLHKLVSQTINATLQHMKGNKKRGENVGCSGRRRCVSQFADEAMTHSFSPLLPTTGENVEQQNLTLTLKILLTDMSLLPDFCHCSTSATVITKQDCILKHQ